MNDELNSNDLSAFIVHRSCFIVSHPGLAALRSSAYSYDNDMPYTAESDRIESSRRLAVDAARLAAATHCTQVVILDVRGLSPITDFLVIATGTSPRQMRSVAEEVMEMAEQRGDRALSSNGLDGGSWIVADFIDIVFHVFSPEARMYYDLDNLWGDARRVEWQTETAVH